MEYVRFRRLSSAAYDLKYGNISVTDVAFKYGYETVESFSKAFKRLFDIVPSRYHESISSFSFAPIKINFSLTGGYCVKRNLIPNLMKVDWSDVKRQNEFVNCVVSALNGLGEKYDYDYVCAVSGSAFRTSFSMLSSQKWNFANYYACYTPITLEHMFKMLGYNVKIYNRSNYEFDRDLIIDSIDRGIPVITLNGVINCSDACLISGYDSDGAILLGYNPYMYINDDHDEVHDDTGYFRKSNWHDGHFSEQNLGMILIIGDKIKKRLTREEIFAETLSLIKRLISEENLALGQYNGLAAHKALANALMTYEWNDNFEPYMCVMCSYKQYIDREYAVKFFLDNNRGDLAEIYQKIANLSKELGDIIPQDFSAFDLFSDKKKLKPYVEVIDKIAALEEEALKIIDSE